jgi:hypothetical protein
MCRVLIGSYRKRQHIEDCLKSMDAHLKGISDVVFIDDSGDTEHRGWLAQYGKVIEVGPVNMGYTKAMRVLSEAAEGEQAFILEEDFTFLEDIHLDQLSEILWYRYYLAQIALLRGSHFPVEHIHGGLIAALEHQGHRFIEVDGIIEQTATFTMNPSLVRGEVWAAGWPVGRWSEERKRDQLLGLGYRFGYLPGVRVEHHGTREGMGY